jgi:two-component system nitrogen regulation sensor histidine kinase NtrY
MKLKIKFILVIITLHLVCLCLSYFIFKEQRIVFVICEAIIIASAIISLGLYRQLIEPLTYLKAGINAIRDRDFNVKFIPTGKTEMDELIDVYNRMIDELRMERVKQEEQHFFLEKLINTSPTGIVILDYDHQVKQINPKAAAILANAGEELMEELNSLAVGCSKTIKAGGFNTYKIQKSHFIDRGFSRVFILMEELTAEIFEAEKGVYGKVIRMMAHEVNNTIGPVNSIINQALAMDGLWIDQDKTTLKDAMQVAVDRNQNLNLFMRNFADLVKLPDVNKQTIDIVTLLRSVAAFMEIKAKEQQVSFHFDLPAEPYLISGDVQQLEQALINIVKNAIEAINGPGRIEFVVNVQSRQLIIRDNGSGISEEENEQLFSPFFSTKKDGQGIGLTMVREILLNHGFEFSLRTVQAGNTEFTILLK